MKMNIFSGKSKWIISLILLSAALISWLYGSKVASVPEHHEQNIQYIQDKEDNAKQLSAAASAVAVLISMIPDDTATPLADQIAGLGTSFLMICAMLTAERFMLYITGDISFCIILPIAAALYILFLFSRKNIWRKFAIKLAFFGIAVYALVPASLRISRMVESNYEEAVQGTLSDAAELEGELGVYSGIYGETEPAQAEIEGTADAGSGSETDLSAAPQTEQLTERITEEEKKSIFEQFSDGVSHTVDMVSSGGEAVKDAATGVIEGAANLIEDTNAAITSIPDLPGKAARMLDSFMESFVIMLVTTCVIPLLTMLGLVWVVNLIAGTYI